MKIHQRLFLLLFVCTIQLTISPVVVGQTITIDGITGIEFDTTGGNYSISITDDFSVFGISIAPQSLTLTYTDSEELFELDGTVETSFDGETISATLDFSISNEALESVKLDVSTNFSLKSLTLEPTDLGFEWIGGTNFGIFGDVTATLDGNEMAVSMGNSDDPGILIENGTISSLIMSISGEFDVKTITLVPDDLTFVYSSDDDQFEMYGSATTTVDDNNITISLGDSDDPGLILDSGSLTHINFGVTADFEMKGITISPSDLTFEYDSDNTQFEFYGDVSVKFDDEEIDASLGDSDDPGIVYNNGSITHVNFSLTADFEVKDLSISPDNLTFEYDSGEEYFEMYGDITFNIGSDEIAANMGDSDDPGLVYNNNSITHVNIGVTEDFSLSGLKIKTNDLGAEWNSGSDYHIYGDADLSIDSETIDTDFGTFSDPGIIVKSGKLHSFNVDVNSDIKLGNLEVESKDLDIKYSSNKFEVSGELEIKELFSLSVTLGEGDQPGLEIDVSGSEPKFKIEALEIDIEHANLGTIDLKLFELKFNSSGIEESDVKVIFPQGWEVDADLKFTGNPAKLNEIEIDYRADNLDDAIEIFEGVQLAYLGATVKNLTKPSQLEVGGTIESIYGGGFTLDGKSATLLEMKDEVTISKYSFDVNGDVNVGAYRTGTDSWHSLLGSGDIDLYARFGHYIRAKAKVKIPGDPLIEADATVYLDNHQHFDALLDVEFIVPHSVPFIGGKHYGSVDGAIRYKHGDLNNSYGAAWVRIKTFWHTYHEGAKYNFGSRKISSIGSGTISSIESQINSETSKAVSPVNNNYSSTIHTFEIPEPTPNSMMIDIDWSVPVDSALITVIGPEGIYELTKGVIISQNDSSTTPTLGYEENMDLVVGDTSTTFIFTTPSAFSEEEIIHASMIDGRYQLVISFLGETAAIDSIQFLPIWQEPEATITATKNEANKFELDIDYWSALPDSTILSFYVEGVGDSNEVKLIDHVYASNFEEDGYGTENLTFTADFVEELDTLYFYAVIDDGINPPLHSDTTTGYIYQPDVFGFLSFPEEADSLESGLRVFVDEDVDGSFDVESTGGLELFALTNDNGYFAFSGLTTDEEYEIRIVLPPGYRLVGGIDEFSSQIILFDGSPIELNLDIEAYSEAE